MQTEKEQTYSEKDIFSVVIIANILQWAVESVIGNIEIMKRLGFLEVKYPSADTVFTRLKEVKREDLSQYFKELAKRHVKTAKRSKLIGKKVELAIDFHKVPRHTKKKFDKRKKRCDDIAYTTGIDWKNGARLAHVFATIQITLYYIKYDYITGNEKKEHAKTNLVIISREEMQRLNYKVDENGKDDILPDLKTVLKKCHIYP